MRLAADLQILVCWILWWYPFLFRAPHVQKRPSITVAGPSRIGLLLQTVALILALNIHVPWDAPISTPLAIAAMVPGPIAVWMGLYEDHRLVRTGAYAVVRHPIYCSMLLLLVAMLIAITLPVWAAILLPLYILGTEIRVRTEERLLASRFPEEFAAYRHKVPAYIPFVR
jgi:protein-S-isoprenylcysteine O-methyltransferase Ste14